MTHIPEMSTLADLAPQHQGEGADCRMRCLCGKNYWVLPEQKVQQVSHIQVQASFPVSEQDT